MRPESSRIISAEPNELLAVKDHCHVGTFPRTNGTERLTGVVSSESAGARIVRCLEATLCAGPAPVCTTSQSAANAAIGSKSANIYQELSANIKYLRCLEATLCARPATTTVCTTPQSHHRHQLQRCNRLLAISKSQRTGSDYPTTSTAGGQELKETVTLASMCQDSTWGTTSPPSRR